MVEGTFPKVDGDILFASEANRFNPKLIGQVQQAVTFSSQSGTAFVEQGGSVLYLGSVTAGSPLFGQIMVVSANVHRSTAANVEVTRLKFSGATANFTTGSNGVGITNPETRIGFDFVLTSGVLNDNGGNIGSPFAVFVEYKTNGAQGFTLSDLVVTAW